jgi:hypothetical protein
MWLERETEAAVRPLGIDRAEPAAAAFARILAAMQSNLCGKIGIMAARTILKFVAGLALFFALIALLPEFDGTRDQDWDTQEKSD